MPLTRQQRAEVCRRTRTAVSELVSEVTAVCECPAAAVRDAVDELYDTDRPVTVERLAVALDHLGYDLVLTAEPQPTEPA